MTTHSIAQNRSPNSTQPARRLLRACVPQFQFEQQRWSTTRTENVEKITETWQENPNLVRVFQDPKFGHMQMALLRKDKLEAMIKLLRDLESGQAAVQHDVAAMFDAVGIVQDLIESKKQALPEELEKPLSKAVRLIVNLWANVSSTIFVHAPTRQVKPSPLSEEEKQPLED